MPPSLLFLAHAAQPAFVGAKVIVIGCVLMPVLMPGRRPWGLFAALMWLSALDSFVLSTDSGPGWRGLYAFTAAADALWGWIFYRRWRDDDEERRPRKRRRVWRLAKAGA